MSKNKEEILKETIKCLEHLINSVGETITEYHWREFLGLSKELIDNFPEYNLEEAQKEYYKNLIKKA